MARIGGRLLLAVAAAFFCATASVPTLAHDAPGGEAGSQQGNGQRAGSDAKEDGVETENLFGFTHGSDTGQAGSVGISAEGLLAVGKRIGTYRALGTKLLELGVGATDDFSISMSALGACHRMRNVPELDDVGGRCATAGVSTEFRWRLLNRRAAPFGLTLHTEPIFTRIDDTSGKPGRGLLADNKIILDRELLPDTLFGAINLIYRLGKFRERFAPETERRSIGGASSAIAVRLSKTTFVGAEVQYLRAYDGLGLDRFRGKAIYAGPSVFMQLTDKAWLSAVWNVQLSGREALDRRELAAGVIAALEAGEDPLAALPVPNRRLDLKNFERHLVRLKVGFDF